MSTSPNLSAFHSTVLPSVETIQVSLNNLQTDQETCNRRIERSKQKSRINNLLTLDVATQMLDVVKQFSKVCDIVGDPLVITT